MYRGSRSAIDRFVSGLSQSSNARSEHRIFQLGVGAIRPISAFGQLALYRVDQSFRKAPLVCQPSLAGKTQPSSWHSIHTGCPVNEERGRFFSQFVRFQTGLGATGAVAH
jgi:hypothetical protein